MKKALLAIASTLTLLIGSMVLPSPASAATFTYFPGGLDMTVGEAYEVDLGCKEPNTTNVYFASGFLPDGLSMDSQGLITGTPTTIGDYTITGLSCDYNGGYSSSDPNYSLTFRVNSALTPIPYVEAFNLSTSDCSIYVAVLFPATPDVGSAYVEIRNQAGTSLRSNSTNLVNPGPASIYSTTYTVAELNNSENFFGSDSTTLTGSEPFACGDSLTVKVGYQTGGAPAAIYTTPVFGVLQPAAPLETGSAPMQRLTALNNDACEFRIVATLPTVAKSGSASITIGVPNSGGNQLTLVLTDETASGVIDFTFNPETLSAAPLTDNRIASEDFQVTSQWECGTRLGISVQYRDLFDNFYSSTWDITNEFLVTPTRPTVSPSDEFSISAVQVEGDCNIRVVTKTPNEARPIAIVIREIDPVDPGSGMDWITGVIITQPASDGGVITANLSFASREAITVSVPVLDEDKIFTEARECSGSYLAAIDYPGGTLASTLITLGKVMPTCNAGSILVTEDAECIPVLRGFYTTDLNSSRPIACPKGMTTAVIASKSINDCYKPIVQTIAGFKAPKPMKFGKSTNLAITTNTKAIAKYKAVGPCKAKVANVVTKVKGKKVTTKMLRVTASKKAGTCSVTLTSVAKDKYLALSKVVKIKVSKSGK